MSDPVPAVKAKPSPMKIVNPQMHANLSDFGQYVELHIYAAIPGKDPDQEIAVADPVVMRVTSPALHNDPFVRISRQSATQLMDSLYRAGIRLTDETPPAPIIASKQQEIDTLKRERDNLWNMNYDLIQSTLTAQHTLIKNASPTYLPALLSSETPPPDPAPPYATPSKHPADRAGCSDDPHPILRPPAGDAA